MVMILCVLVWLVACLCFFPCPASAALEASGYCGAVMTRAVSCVASASNGGAVTLPAAVCAADTVWRPASVVPCGNSVPSQCGNASAVCAAHMCSGHGTCANSSTASGECLRALAGVVYSLVRMLIHFHYHWPVDI